MRLVSIPRDNQTQEHIERGADWAGQELIEATIAVNACVACLAKMYPNVTAIMGMDHGQPLGTLAFARSQQCNHFLPSAMDAAKTLAVIVANLPEELRAVFEITIDFFREREKLMAGMKKARADALAADKETPSA